MFQYPGQYVVVVAGEYKRQKQFARKTITVLPVELELSKSDDGQSYVLRNTSVNEIDIGGYRLTGNHEHVFPRHTIILPQSQVNLPIRVTNNNRAIAALYDEGGEAIALHVPGYTAPAQIVQLTELVNQPSGQSNSFNDSPATQKTVSSPGVSDFGFASAEIVTVPAEKIEPVPQPAAPQIAAAAGAPNNPLQENWPTFALLALLILGTIGIYLVPQKKDDPPWV